MRDTQPASNATTAIRTATNRALDMNCLFQMRHTELVEQLGAVTLSVYARCVARFVDGQCVDHAACLQDEHAVGKRNRLVHVVRHEQHTEAVFAPQVEQQPAHAQAGQCVQRAERLVEQQ